MGLGIDTRDKNDIKSDSRQGIFQMSSFNDNAVRNQKVVCFVCILVCSKENQEATYKFARRRT